MNNKKFINSVIMLVFFHLPSASFGTNSNQISNWKVFTNEEIGISGTTFNQIIEDMESKIWIGSVEEGLLCYDGGNWTRFDTTNSPLPENNISSLEVDSANNLWIGMMGIHGGLSKFDGISWTVWNLTEYGIENPIVMDLEFDSEGKLWLGTYGDGLIKFDGEHFTIFNSQTTDLDENLEEINTIKIDGEGHIWCGTDIRGAMNFDGVSEWTYYHSYEYEIDNAIYSIDIDHENNIWFGGVWFISQFDGASVLAQYDYSDDGGWYTDIIIDSNKTIWFASWTKGFLKLDYSNGEVWEKYTPYGFTELENEGCWAAYKDSKGNMWIGYNNGYIGLYNQDGITSILEIESFVPSDYNLTQNYPNPFNPATVINYALPENSNVKIEVFSMIGQSVALLVDTEKSSGFYNIAWNASDLPSGIYFISIIANGMNSNISFRQVKKAVLLK